MTAPHPDVTLYRATRRAWDLLRRKPPAAAAATACAEAGLDPAQAPRIERLITTARQRADAARLALATAGAARAGR